LFKYALFMIQLFNQKVYWSYHTCYLFKNMFSLQRCIIFGHNFTKVLLACIFKCIIRHANWLSRPWNALSTRQKIRILIGQFQQDAWFRLRGFDILIEEIRQFQQDAWFQLRGFDILIEEKRFKVKTRGNQVKFVEEI